MSSHRFGQIPSGFDADDLQGLVDESAIEALLVEACRNGTPGAVLELYRRHWEAVCSFAATFSAVRQDAEDIAATAFLKTLTAIHRGSGPVGPVRPYLFRAVRTSAADHYSARDTPSDRIAETVDRLQSYPVTQSADHDLVAEAFRMLPDRWQRVLWYIEIEGLRPRETAPLLAVTPNAVSALLRRARRGLREAYLACFIREHPHQGCSQVLGILAAAGFSAGEGFPESLRGHVRTCRDCSKVIRTLDQVRSSVRGILYPGLLATLFSPVTAVRILELASSSPLPLGSGGGTVEQKFAAGIAVKKLLAACAALAALAMPVTPAGRTPTPSAVVSRCAPHYMAGECWPLLTSANLPKP